MSTKQQKFTYRNISDATQALIDVGVVEPGETIVTSEPVSNPNFEEVIEKKAKADNEKVEE